MTDDDIRSMLRAKAEEATVSPDAWDRIQARIDDRSAARPKRVLAGVASGAVAAAVVAGLVLSQNGPSSPAVADPSTTSITTGTTTPMATNAAIQAAVDEWLADRFAGDFEAGTYAIAMATDGESANVRFDGGEIATELVVVPLSGRPGWAVLSAVSDQLRLLSPTFDGHELVVEAVPEVDGRLVVNAYFDGSTQAVALGSRDVTAREQESYGWQEEGHESVLVRAVLTLADGSIAYAEQQAEPVTDAGSPTGSFVALFPATDAPGLASLQAQANQGRREDLLDPQAVAGGFLAERLPRDQSPTSYQVGDFQRGDASSGEVPYTLSDGSEGVVLVRTTNEGDTPIWYVVGVTSDTLSFPRDPYREGTNLQADVESTRAGTLRWVGAPDIQVGAGQKVTIGRPDTPEVGSYPVVIQLMDGDRTLAIVARLG